MKVLQFTIPVQHDKSILTRIDVLPYFYPYLHRHKEMQITWVQQGEGTLIVNNNMHIFHSNDIYILGANQPHVFKSDPSYFSTKSKKIISSLDIFFNPEGPLSSMFSLPEMKNLKSFIQLNQKGCKVPQQYAAEISNKMLLLKQCNDSIAKVTHFIELLQKLSTFQEDLLTLSSHTTAASFGEYEGIRISNIYSYIMQHYDKEITLEEVAAQAYMTPQAFCRYFKKHTRYTFISFLNEIRINEACKKLTDGDYDNISTIAYNCGFNSISNFNRVFKSIIGKSPSEYVSEYNLNINVEESGHEIVAN
jgi:AraC-like DNA-binding protein